MTVKYRLKKGELIHAHDIINKNKLLADKAVKEDLAIIVGKQLQADNFLKINPDIKIIRVAQNFTIELKNNIDNYPNGVLIDESVDSKMISEIIAHGYVVRGGFVKDKEV